MIKGLYEAHLPVSDIEESIMFYEKIGLELAHKSERVSFMWIVKGESWIGLWDSEQVDLPYHPSIKHLAFHVDRDNITHAKEWLESRNIQVRDAFGFTPDRQPLVLPNNPQAHAAIYFNDPDGNSLELIAPLRIDVDEDFEMLALDEWEKW